MGKAKVMAEICILLFGKGEGLSLIHPIPYPDLPLIMLLNLWSRCDATFVFLLQIPSTEGGVRMLQCKGISLYIGTTLNGIVTATLNPSGPALTDAKLNDKPITRVKDHWYFWDYFIDFNRQPHFSTFSFTLTKAVWRY